MVVSPTPGKANLLFFSSRVFLAWTTSAFKFIFPGADTVRIVSYLQIFSFISGCLSAYIKLPSSINFDTQILYLLFA